MSGDTQALNTEVELSTPPETIEIYNQLMGESPFVSETVVESVIDKEMVLPNAMVRDVMVANPHSATSDELMDKLDERYNPMPNYMKAQILQGKEIISLKQELESELANYKLKQGRAISGLIRQYLTDTINPESASDSIVDLYQQINDKSIMYRLAMLHLQRGEYNQGSSVLNSITAEYDLSIEEMQGYNTFVDYYTLVKNIKQDARTELEANENEVQQLVNIENAGSGIASCYARNILIASDEMQYLAPIQLPNLYKSTKKKEDYQEIMNAVPPSQLSVFPNPSKGYVIIEYHLEMEKEGIIEVKDANGITERSVNIDRLQNQVTVITQDWKPGIYIATLKIDGKSIESIKFTIIK